MRHKKAQGTKSFAFVVGIVLLLALAFVVYVAFIRPSGTTAKGLIGSVGSCKEPLGGKEGECDCFFSGVCPGGSEGTLNRNCPSMKYGPCTTIEQGVTNAKKAQDDFETKVEEIEKAQGKLPASLYHELESQYFGQCCAGAEKPAVTG